MKHAKMVLFAALLVITGNVQAIAQTPVVTFGTVQSEIVGTDPSDVAVGDFNNDGKPDLVVRNIGHGTIPGSVSLLLGDGHGGLQPAIDVPVNGYPGALAIGDFNGDGRLDIAITIPNSNDEDLEVLLGNGDGTFKPPITTLLSFTHQSPSFIAAGDFNGDHNLDLLAEGFDDTGGSETYVATVLSGNGDGTFTAGSSTLVSTATGGGRGAIADFNQDGKLDVAFPDPDSQSILLLLGDGDGSFQPVKTIQLPGSAAYLAAGDLNHDAIPDLVATAPAPGSCKSLFCRRIGSSDMIVLIGKGDGTFQSASVFTTGDFGPAAFGDFDGDGNPDVAIAGADDNLGGGYGVNVYSGTGAGALNKGILVPTYTNVITAADLNQDGLTDFVEVTSPAEFKTINNVGVQINTTVDFALSLHPQDNHPISAGKSASFSLGVTGHNGFNNSIGLTCSAPTAQGVICNLSASSLTPGQNATMTVATTARSAGLTHPSSQRRFGFFYALWLVLPAMLVVVRLAAARRGNSWKVSVGVLLLAGLIMQVSCGGGSSSTSGTSNATPAGTYTVTVLANGGNMTRTGVASVQVVSSVD